MRALGLFPLELVLLPTEQLPLHIFEPRYQELVGECVDDERPFGLVLADSDGVREIGTEAFVTEVLQRFDDGRLNIVIEGGQRFRLRELTSGRSFQTGEVEAFDDEPDVAAGDEEERARGLFRRLAEVTETDIDEPDQGVALLSFRLAARVALSADLKQELLELRSERERLLRVCELFEQAARTVALERELREHASGNGKVSPRPRLQGEPNSE